MADLTPVGRVSFHVFALEGVATHTPLSSGQYDAIRYAATRDEVSLGWLNMYREESDAVGHCADYNNTTKEIKAISVKGLLAALFEGVVQ